MSKARRQRKTESDERTAQDRDPTGNSAIAADIARLAIHTGTIDEVVQYLTGTHPESHLATPGRPDTLTPATTAGPVQEDTTWDGIRREPEYSGHTKRSTEEACSTELFNLTTQVRERRISRKTRGKPKSS